MTGLKKAIFLDRDGVINKIVKHPELKDIKGNICLDPLKIKEFKIIDGVKKAIKDFRKLGYELIIISNQPGLIKGFYKKELLEKINKKIKKELGIEHIYYCLHHPDYTGNCECRKPKPGLILKSAKELNIDLKNSYMVGDQEKDIVAGKKVGCKTVWIRKNYPGINGINKPNFVCNNLNEFVNFLKN